MTVCTRCLDLADAGRLRYEGVMPLRGGALDSLARDGSGPCCVDCDTADLLVAMGGGNFEMARVAVSNARQEQLRLHGAPADFGLGVPLKNHDRTLEDHHDWLDDAIPGWCNI